MSSPLKKRSKVVDLVGSSSEESSCEEVIFVKSVQGTKENSKPPAKRGIAPKLSTRVKKEKFEANEETNKESKIFEEALKDYHIGDELNALDDCFPNTQE